MCGKVGAAREGLDPSEAENEDVSQWYRACSRAGKRAYPYGADFVEGQCNDDSGTGSTAAIASFSNCVGGYNGLRDLSGNVREWEHSCDGVTGVGDTCGQRGGSFDSAEQELACADVREAQRAAAYADVGFRCCYDPE